MKVNCIWYSTLAICFMINKVTGKPKISLDKSVTDYFNEKICWWDEICKNEFKSAFNCRCPKRLNCRSPGRYYDAYCSIMDSGYVWLQPFNATNATSNVTSFKL